VLPNKASDMIYKLLAGSVMLFSAQAQAQSVGVDDWAGPYVGATVGYAWSDFEPQVDPTFIEQGLDEDLNHEADGWTAGIAAGYNMQSRDWVYGVELNASIARVKGSAENDVQYTIPGVNGGAPFDLDQTQESKIRDLFSARLRVGRAFGPVLVYAAGGIAGATAETDFEVRSIFGNVVSDDKRFHTGYTVGAGIDYRLTPRLTTKLEYAFYEFGSKEHQTVAFDLNQQLIRTGISYHFGG